MTTRTLSSIALSFAFAVGSMPICLTALAAEGTGSDQGTGQSQQSLDLSKKHGSAKGKVKVQEQVPEQGMGQVAASSRCFDPSTRTEMG